MSAPQDQRKGVQSLMFEIGMNALTLIGAAFEGDPPSSSEIKTLLAAAKEAGELCRKSEFENMVVLTEADLAELPVEVTTALLRFARSPAPSRELEDA